MKLIIVTPAGRERYMRLLSHYVLASPAVTEWHLWDNCRTVGDRRYLRQLAASDPRCKLKERADADGTTESIGDFFRFCDDAEALYLRLDDDIVFVESNLFERFIAKAQTAAGDALWFSPLVINNGICNWMLQHFSRVVIEGPVTCGAMCPYSWAFASFPAALHPVFIDAVRRKRLADFRVPDREVRLSRFSINALGFFGRDKMAIGDMFYPPDRNEEEWLSAILPAKLNKGGKIFGDLAVAHFSYYTQEQQLLRMDLLASYYALAGLPMPHFELPRRGSFYRRLKDRLMPWRHAKRRRGPHYTIALRETPT